ncbi:MAG: hypothetical protein PHF49_04565 [Patescibacteria group bacterium]|nr:hypothetical protein [Patescibacteria group bacterium]
MKMMIKKLKLFFIASIIFFAGGYIKASALTTLDYWEKNFTWISDSDIQLMIDWYNSQSTSFKTYNYGYSILSNPQTWTNGTLPTYNYKARFVFQSNCGQENYNILLQGSNFKQNYGYMYASLNSSCTSTQSYGLRNDGTVGTITKDGYPTMFTTSMSDTTPIKKIVFSTKNVYYSVSTYDVRFIVNEGYTLMTNGSLWYNADIITRDITGKYGFIIYPKDYQSWSPSYPISLYFDYTGELVYSPYNLVTEVAGSTNHTINQNETISFTDLQELSYNLEGGTGSADYWWTMNYVFKNKIRWGLVVYNVHYEDSLTTKIRYDSSLWGFALLEDSQSTGETITYVDEDGVTNSFDLVTTVPLVDLPSYYSAATGDVFDNITTFWAAQSESMDSLGDMIDDLYYSIPLAFRSFLLVIYSFFWVYIIIKSIRS